MEISHCIAPYLDNQMFESDKLFGSNRKFNKLGPMFCIFAHGIDFQCNVPFSILFCFIMFVSSALGHSGEGEITNVQNK